jgi:transcriptional repressor NrdR
MRCFFCGSLKSKVVNSRANKEKTIIRRRRECLTCRRKFTTYERREEIPIKVVKKDGRREGFDRKKIRNGLVKACEKRPISMETIEEIVQEIEQEVQNEMKNEISSQLIGEMVMKKLHKLDEIAYVRFASVYRQFKDVGDFMQEVRRLLGKAPQRKKLKRK